MDLVTGTTTTARPPATPEIVLIISFTYLVLSIIGLLPNILLLFVLVRTQYTGSQTAFFRIAFVITLCDIGQLMSQIIVAFPIAYYSTNIFSGTGLSWVYSVFTIVDTVSYNGILFFTLIMAINRFCVFMWHSAQNFLFSGKRVIVTLIVTTLILCFEVTLSNILTCTKKYSSKGFYFYITCSNTDSFTTVWYEIMKEQSYVLPVFMFILYIVIFISIRSSLAQMRNMETIANSGQRKTEIRLLVQSAIICCFLELQTLSFSILPRIGTGYGYYYSNMAQNIISIVNNSINPYIYLMFNSKIRNELLSYFRPTKTKTSHITVTVRHHTLI